ncbi:hypothetical protein TYRP_010300 [Tyrophagus putrescentiae]|nr:hypothetical protein TYRP_010300 [Tyrophagus putrescentiae]
MFGPPPQVVHRQGAHRRLVLVHGGSHVERKGPGPNRRRRPTLRRRGRLFSKALLLVELHLEVARQVGDGGRAPGNRYVKGRGEERSPGEDRRVLAVEAVVGVLEVHHLLERRQDDVDVRGEVDGGREEKAKVLAAAARSKRIAAATDSL